MKLIPLSYLTVLFFISSYLSLETGTYTGQDPLQESIERGAEIYTDFCMNCHLASGEGVENVYLTAGRFDIVAEVQTPDDASMKNQEESIRGLKYGQQGEITVNGKKYNSFMPPPGLGDDEVADVMNYINNSWGNKNTKIVTEADVAAIKK